MSAAYYRWKSLNRSVRDMTKQKQIEYLEKQIDELKEKAYELERLNYHLREITEKLEIKSFEDWNESGISETIGNTWHVKWTDYIHEKLTDKSHYNELIEEIPYILEKSFNAGTLVHVEKVEINM